LTIEKIDSRPDANELKLSSPEWVRRKPMLQSSRVQ